MGNGGEMMGGRAEARRKDAVDVHELHEGNDNGKATLDD